MEPVAEFIEDVFIVCYGCRYVLLGALLAAGLALSVRGLIRSTSDRKSPRPKGPHPFCAFDVGPALVAWPADERKLQGVYPFGFRHPWPRA